MLHVEFHFKFVSGEVISSIADGAHININLQSDIHLSGQYL